MSLDELRFGDIFQPNGQITGRARYDIAQTEGFVLPPLSIDGSNQAATASGLSQAISVTTTKSHVLIFILIHWYTGGGGVTLSTVTSAHLSWTAYTTFPGFGANDDFWVYYALAPTPVTAEMVTCTFTGVSTLISLISWGVVGAPSKTFDPNITLPAKSTSTTPVVISTSHAVDMLIVCNGDPSGGNPIAATDGTWTLLQDINNVAYMDTAVQVKAVSSVQTLLSVNFNAGILNEGGTCGFAVENL